MRGPAVLGAPAANEPGCFGMPGGGGGAQVRRRFGPFKPPVYTTPDEIAPGRSRSKSPPDKLFLRTPAFANIFLNADRAAHGKFCLIPAAP